MHKISVYTGGELHDLPADLPPVDFTLNLSRVLEDPAHRPEGDMLDMTGLDPDVQRFVFETEGANELLDGWLDLLHTQSKLSPVVVLVLCRGGRHRSVAFAEALVRILVNADVDAELVRHLHVHLPRVIRQETKS